MTLVPGSELARMTNLDEFSRALDETYGAYEKFADQLIGKEMKFDEKKAWTSALRRMLPDGIATNIVWSANHRALRWVLEMRTSPGAEVEMRYVFDKVGDILQRDYPTLYGDFMKKPHTDGVGHQWVPQLRSKV
jgi:thymidylate synthase (FAD)